MTDKPQAADPASAGSAPGGSAPAAPAGDPAGERIVIRDKRRIDPSGGGSTAGSAGAQEAGATAATGTEPGTDGEPAAGAEQGDGATSTGVGSATAMARDEQAAKAAEPAVPVDDADVAEVIEPVPVVPSTEGATERAAEPSDEAVDRAGPLGAELQALRSELDERTSDLQRVSAEYANYRKRVDRDRGLVAEQATAQVLVALLPILDDLDRAREHGDLVGPFGTVAEQLNGAVGKLGLTPFGEKGDRFDPTRHEAVAHQTSSEVAEPTCVTVMRRGYLLGDRLLRPALVAVAEPE